MNYTIILNQPQQNISDQPPIKTSMHEPSHQKTQDCLQSEKKSQNGK